MGELHPTIDNAKVAKSFRFEPIWTDYKKIPLSLGTASFKIALTSECSFKAL